MPPLPKPAGQARHRNKPMANTVKLPAEGRKGRTPKYPYGPLDKKWSAVWRDLWRTPSAVMWERNSWTRTVARYLRVLQAAEEGLDAGKPSAAILAEVRQMEDRLGLTPVAMLRLRWEIGTDELAERRPVDRPRRRKLVAVDPS